VQTSLGTVPREQVHGLDDAYDAVDVDLLVRPDDLVATPVDDIEANGRVEYRRFLGPNVLYRVELDNGDVVGCMHNHEEDVPLDQPVRVELATDHELSWFPDGVEYASGDPRDQ
jgi:iron(III) transport system ATP-binding protein